MIKDFTAVELAQVFLLAGITPIRHSQLGWDWVITLRTDDSSSHIMVSKGMGWISFARNIVTKAIKDSPEYEEAFKWKLAGVHRPYPRSLVDTKTHYNPESVVSCLRFKISAIDDLEVLIETVQSVFDVIKYNEKRVGINLW